MYAVVATVSKLNGLRIKVIGKSLIINLDVNSKESVNNLVDKITEKNLDIHILVNNAGISDPKKFKDLSEESWLNIIETNLNGAFRVAKAVTDLMIKNKIEGNIINIASILGLRVGLNLTSYASAKAGLIQLTKSMALELARSNIRVNAIAPGYIRTEMTQGGIDDKEMFPVWRNMTPMGRVGEPEEIATAALFLCTPASSYVSGEVLVVDGAYLTR